jgi:hypothetical protein
MKEAPGSSETSVLTRATWRNNPEDIILHSFMVVSYVTCDKGLCALYKLAVIVLRPQKAILWAWRWNDKQGSSCVGF